MNHRILVDSNVLLRSIEPDHVQFDVARQSIYTLGTNGATLLIAPQIIYELWVVCTRPVEQNGVGLTIDDTAEEVSKILNHLVLLMEEPKVFLIWHQLVITNKVLGKRAHDARLIAMMLVHKVTHLLTFNTQDFQSFKDIVVLHPDEVLQSANNPP